MKKTYATYNKKVYEAVNGIIQFQIVPIDVRVMAIAEGYAMVRRKGAMPFCCLEKDLIIGEKK